MLRILTENIYPQYIVDKTNRTQYNFVRICVFPLIHIIIQHETDNYSIARTEGLDKILGLELVADDYITKPFSSRKLLAKVKAVMRGSQRKDAPVKLSYKAIVVDKGAYTV